MNRYAVLGMLLSLLLTVGISSPWAESEGIQATIIDRAGTRFEVSSFQYHEHDTFSFSRGTEWKTLKFRRIEKIEFLGGRSDEEPPIRVTLLDGKTLAGTVRVGGAGSGGYTYGTSSPTFTGKTNLGKFVISLKDIKEVIFHHEKQAVKRCPTCGRKFEQEGYRFCPYDGTKLEAVNEDTTKVKAPQPSKE
ncbi:MAG: zinc ribbon domain-containing protein [Candidatus Latescibacteria bacterium]|nr:zinc ribbon domain-containing protein [Candidatus Latescibacterota bacterium]